LHSTPQSFGRQGGQFRIDQARRVLHEAFKLGMVCLQSRRSAREAPLFHKLHHRPTGGYPTPLLPRLFARVFPTAMRCLNLTCRIGHGTGAMTRTMQDRISIPPCSAFMPVICVFALDRPKAVAYYRVKDDPSQQPYSCRASDFADSSFTNRYDASEVSVPEALAAAIPDLTRVSIGRLLTEEEFEKLRAVSVPLA